MWLSNRTSSKLIGYNSDHKIMLIVVSNNVNLVSVSDLTNYRGTMIPYTVYKYSTYMYI